MNPGCDHPQCHAFVHGIGGWHETSNGLVAGAWALAGLSWQARSPLWLRD